MQFEKILNPSTRAAAIVGDKLSIIGKPTSGNGVFLFNVADQPSGSDIFSGLGTAGANLSFAELDSATFAITGFYAFTVTGANGDAARFEFLCWPAAVLTVDGIKYASRADKGANTARSPQEQRSVLRALAGAATQAGAEATLETTLTAPYYGATPVSLGASATTSLYQFGGW